MAEEYGLFWNSRGGDRKYHADSFSDWLKKFFTTGVFNGDLFVESAEGMDITVSPGYVNIDGKVMMWDGVQNFTLDVAYSTYDRIDAVVVERNDPDRIFTTKVVKGGTDGQAPLPVRSDGVYQIVLAYIAVGQGVTAITQADITDKRMDSDLCGWVTGTVEEIAFDQIVAQWGAYYQNFKHSQMQDWLEWSTNMQTDYTEWTTAKKNEWLAWISSNEQAFEAWQGDMEAAYEEWVEIRKAGWLEWVRFHEEEWATWSDVQRAAWAFWISQQEADIAGWKDDMEADLSRFSQDIQAEYTQLASELHDLIDGEAAAILQEQIDELREEIADKSTIVQIPSIVVGTYTYDGTEKAPTITGLDTTHTTVTGTTSATAAGDYTFTIALKDSTMVWADLTRSPIVTNWSIAERILAIPYLTDKEQAYDGTMKQPTVHNLDTDWMNVEGRLDAISVGIYPVSFTLKNTESMKWTDDTRTAKTDQWRITNKFVTVPTISDPTKVYNGSSQSPSLVNPDAEYLTISGDTSGTNVGSYTITFSLNNTQDYKWEDGTTEDKTATWTIERKPVEIPTVTDTTKTYSGAAQSPTISNPAGADVTTGGTTSATNVGSYTITFDLADANNFKWSDDTTAQKTASWSIGKLTVTIPSVTNTSKTYNGSAQSPTITNPMSAYVVTSGYTSATNAGNYAVKFNLASVDNMKWSDNTTTQKTANWSIAKATQTITLSANTVLLDSTTPNATVTVTYNGDGAVTATSSDTTVVTTTVS